MLSAASLLNVIMQAVTKNAYFTAIRTIITNATTKTIKPIKTTKTTRTTKTNEM